MDKPKKKAREERKTKRKAAYLQKKEQEKISKIKSEGYTHSFHSDNKPTLVEVEGTLYKLVSTGGTIKQLRKEKDFDKIPHVRYLNPIPLRNNEEQRKRNLEQENIHKLALQISTGSDKVTSLKKAIILGKDIPKEIEKLFKEKEEAQKKGDEKRCREIRRQLRALDYKRYITKGKEVR